MRSDNVEQPATRRPLEPLVWRQWWTVGRLHDPMPEELLKPFDELAVALEMARDRAGCDDRDVIAVWDRHCDVVAVFTGGNKFVPA